MSNDYNDLQIGQVVRSMAGRDKGDWMVVTEILDGDYVNVSNGKNRKISQPKKKKIKHLAKTNHVSPLVQEKLRRKIKITNSDLRHILEPFVEKTKV